MKKFDWEEAKNYHSPEAWEFLKTWHNINVAEWKFVEMWCKLRKFSKKKKGKKMGANYRTYKSRRIYRRLKERFGFFQ